MARPKGAEPTKAYALRLPVRLHREVQAAAAADRRSVNQEITVAVAEWLAARKRKGVSQ
jgi:predicted HicB family RNase H-like nuclease